MATPDAPPAETFDDLVLYWQQELGLQDWRLSRAPRPVSGRVLAQIQGMDLAQRVAEYRLGQGLSKGAPTSEQLNALACHEMLHLLLFELAETIRADAPAALIDAAEHRVVNTLTRLLAGDLHAR